MILFFTGLRKGLGNPDGMSFQFDDKSSINFSFLIEFSPIDGVNSELLMYLIFKSSSGSSINRILVFSNL